MALLKCPICNAPEFTWFIDEDESIFTQWKCNSCNVHFLENERKKSCCLKCNDPELLLFISEHGIVSRWCSSCNTLNSVDECFSTKRSRSINKAHKLYIEGMIVKREIFDMTIFIRSEVEDRILISCAPFEYLNFLYKSVSQDLSSVISIANCDFNPHHAEEEFKIRNKRVQRIVSNFRENPNHCEQL